MIIMTLIFLPSFISLVYGINKEVKRKSYLSAGVMAFLFAAISSYFTFSWETSIESVKFPNYAFSLFSLLYTLIIPVATILICDKMGIKWKGSHVFNMFLLTIFNLIPYIDLRFDLSPISNQPFRPGVMSFWAEGKSVIDIYIKDFVMVVQLCWAISLMAKTWNEARKKHYHFIKTSHYFGATLLMMLVTAAIANMLPMSAWNSPMFLSSYVLVLSIYMCVLCIMIGRGYMIRPVLDENEEPAADTFTENIADIWEGIKDIVESKQQYHNPDLQLSDVAHALGTNRIFVAQAISDNTGLGFSSYLNKLRCEEAMMMIIGNKDMSLKDISDECGFVDTSIFMDVFKKEMGISPSQVRIDIKK